MKTYEAFDKTSYTFIELAYSSGRFIHAASANGIFQPGDHAIFFCTQRKHRDVPTRRWSRQVHIYLD